MNTPNKIAVIGAGPMGLACAYELLNKGYHVDIYEKDHRLGGMSASFDFDGLMIERYYHFICKTDHTLFELLKKLNIEHKLHWQETAMGFFYHGVLYKWGNPLYLLQFPHLGGFSKLRYALHILYTKNIKDWHQLDQINAVSWLKKWVGEKAYMQLWDYLFELKFYEHKHDISAAWIGTRIKRVALSRKSLFTEQLAYLEGGSETLLHALQERILSKGGNIYLKTGIDQLDVIQQHLQGVVIQGHRLPYQSVVSTLPLPYVPQLIPQLPTEILNKIRAINNAGVVCVILKLHSSLTKNFWLNINDPSIEIPGLIEYTNLYPLSEHILYVPFYMLKNHPKYRQEDAFFVNEVVGYLHKINPHFSQTWVLASHVSRYEFAQPICTSCFYQKLPPLSPPIQGLFMADTSYYYPEDRSISESIRIGNLLADLVEEYLKKQRS